MTKIRIKQPCDHPREMIVGENELIAVDVNVATGILPASTGTLDMMQAQPSRDIGEVTGIAILYITEMQNLSSDQSVEELIFREGNSQLSESLENVESVNGLQIACNENYIAMKSSRDVRKGEHRYHFIFQYLIENNHWTHPYNGLLSVKIK